MKILCCCVNAFLLLLLSLISLAIQGHVDHSHIRGDFSTHVGDRDLQGNEKVRRCGTKEMSDEDRKARDHALSFVKLKKRKHGREYQANAPKVIPVCFHVVGGNVPRQSLKRDLEALNKAYSTHSCCDETLSWCNGECSTPETSIRFLMARSFLGHIIGTVKSPISCFACVRRSQASSDMSPGSYGELAVKRSMRRGDGRVLNIYYASLSDGLLGYAYFPFNLNNQPILDGVVVERDSRVGGSLAEYNEGDTLAHEVG
jgi:hypothetical protein